MGIATGAGQLSRGEGLSGRGPEKVEKVLDEPGGALYSVLTLNAAGLTEEAEALSLTN